MYYYLNCKGCELQLRVSKEHQGKIVQCPSCKAYTRIIVEDADTGIAAKPSPPVEASSQSSAEGVRPADPTSLEDANESREDLDEAIDTALKDTDGQPEESTKEQENADPSTDTGQPDGDQDEEDGSESAATDDEGTADEAASMEDGESQETTTDAEDAEDAEPDEPEVQSFFGYEFKIDPEEITASLTMIKSPDPIRSKTQMMMVLRKNDVTYGLDDNQMRIAFMYLDSDDAKDLGTTFVIARGTPAAAGRNGRVDFDVDVTGAAQFQVSGGDDGKRVNFKEATRIAVVRPGQLLARLVPPTRGQRGTGLDGKETAAMPGEAANITVGEGARADESGREFYAMIEGRPIFEKGVLSVAEVYEIEGDVDYETGNIRFGGHVVVQGAVLDDFEIDCKSLEVHGTVGSARITTEGDAFLHGGVNGQERGRLTVGGNLITKYLNQVNATVEGNVVSERGITNSTIYASGDVQAERIVGGNTVAFLGLEVNFLGSDLGVVTQAQAGVDYKEVQAREALADIDARLPDLQKLAMPYLKPGPALKRMPEKRREEAKTAFEEYKTLTAQRAMTEQTLTLMEADEETEPIRMVNVGSEIFGDVILRTGIYIKEFKANIKGQMTFMPDEELNTWEMHPYRKRPVKATGASDEE